MLTLISVPRGTGTLSVTGVSQTGGGAVSVTNTGAGTITGGVSTAAASFTLDVTTNINVNSSITSNVRVFLVETPGGTGTGNGTVTQTGIVAPGNSSGILSVTGAYGPVGELDMDLTGTNVGTEYDQVSVTGSVDVTGTDLNFNLTFGPFRLINSLD